MIDTSNYLKGKEKDDYLKEKQIEEEVEMDDRKKKKSIYVSQAPTIASLLIVQPFSHWFM